jgi:hypothetical protein
MVMAPMRSEASISYTRCVIAVAAIIALQALILWAMNHPLICTCGRIDLWHGSHAGPETSQHLTDWYTLSHIVHGFGFYLLLWLVAPRLSVGTRLVLAVGVEAGWEVIENTPWLMARYRQGALAAGYFGDSVVNSVADTLAMMVGFILARLLPAWSTVVLALALELVALVSIRDNLALNIIQLVHPTEAISRWQTGKQAP